MWAYVGLLCVDLGVFGSMCSIARICIADALQPESVPVAEAHEHPRAFMGVSRRDIFFTAPAAQCGSDEFLRAIEGVKHAGRVVEFKR